MTPTIVVHDLVKRFGDVCAVDGISFEVRPGMIFGLLGRNGAGKTTTLECCIGLRKPTAGTIRILDLDPWDAAQFKRLRPRFGAQLQATSLPDKAKVKEILELYAVYYGCTPSVGASCARVGLEGKEDRLVSALSGGEKQRLALALALQHDPDIVLLDETTAGMDAFGRRVLWAEVERLRTARKTVILTTHYIEEAERLCDLVCIVQQGKIVAQETPAALIAGFGGGTLLTIAAEGFDPRVRLKQAGTWSRRDDRWVLCTQLEPGPIAAEIARIAGEGGIVLHALDIRRATLEDAFLNITGEQIEDGAA